MADVGAVLLFVVLGRSSHQEGSAVVGTLATAWPFLTGTALGWLALLAGRGRYGGRGVPSPESLPGGVAVLVSTVLVGMLLRHGTGAGTPASFVVVATTFLALFLLGWRLLTRWVARR